jgi:hypothetical protein
MALIVKPFTFSAGGTIFASDHNSNYDTVYNLVNGNIDNTNLSASAAIPDTMLNQLTTAQKVSATTFTNLASITTAAGTIPVFNLPTGTSANQLVVLNSSAQLPAVDGSLLTKIGTTLLSTTTFNAITSQVITGLTSGNKYMFVSTFVQTGTNGQAYLLCNGDNGGNYRWVTLKGSPGSSGNAGANSAAAGVFMVDASFVKTGEPCSIVGYLQPNFTNSNKTEIEGTSQYLGQDGNMNIVTFGGQYTGASATSSFTLASTQGTITGDIRVYKLG